MTGTADETTYEPDPQRWKALTVCLTAGFMTLLDVSIVNVALPSIRAGLGASDGELQWIVSGYALSFGLVLVAAGRLGDMRGRRTLFVVGVVVFTVSSMLAGIAPNPTWLVLARLLQGVGGGIINPQVSGLIQQLFRGRERGRAFGRLGTVIGISTAIGGAISLVASTITGGPRAGGSGGVSTAMRNPVAPWVIPYGRCCVGGTIVYTRSFGESDQWLDLVIVLAACRIEGFDGLLFDKKRVQLEDHGNGTYDSFTPLQQTVSIVSITRVNGVVTCTIGSAIPLAAPGDVLELGDVVTDPTFNGRFPIESTASGNTVFVFICGGPDGRCGWRPTWKAPMRNRPPPFMTSSSATVVGARATCSI